MALRILVVELTICFFLSLDLVCSTAGCFVGSGREYGRKRIGFAECRKWDIRVVLWFCIYFCCFASCGCAQKNKSVEDTYQRVRPPSCTRRRRRGGREGGDETVTAELVVRCFSVACAQRIEKKGCAQHVDVVRQLPKPQPAGAPRPSVTHCSSFPSPR